MDEYKYINFERTDGRADLTLTSLPHNLLSVEMLEEMLSALDGLRDDDTLKVLLIRGEGGIFCGGVQVDDLTAERIGSFMPIYTRSYGFLNSIRGLVVAAIEGEALGHGCELAGFCDVTIAAESARFGFPSIKRGPFPPVAAATPPRLVGRNRVVTWVNSGRSSTAIEAVEGHLITKTIPEAVMNKYVDSYVEDIAGYSAPAVVLAKRAVDAAMYVPVMEALTASESTYMLDLLSCLDPHEGLRASIEERQPVWKNR